MALTIKTTGIDDYLDGGNAYIKALIMGAPSAGKTRSSSFWPKPILADCEKGRMSVADRGIPYAEILCVQDMKDLMRMLALECKKPLQQRKYQTVIIDTLDAYQRIVISERLTNEKKDALSGWADWGYLDGQMTSFVAALQNLPMNIVVNLHVKSSMVGEEDAKVEVIGPKLKGDLREQIAAEFDLVGFMGTYYAPENGERVLKRGIQWHPEPGKPILKDRSGQLPKWTAVNFDEEDYGTLFTTLISHLDNLPATTEVETLPEHVAEKAKAPVAPMKGGPVASTIVTTAAAEPKKAAKAAPAKSPAIRAEEEADPNDVPMALATGPGLPAATLAGARAAVPPAARPVPPAPRPAPVRPVSPPVTPETSGAEAAPVGVDTQTGEMTSPESVEQVVTDVDALDLVTEELGATVVSDEATVDDSVTEDEATPEPVTEDVAEAGGLVCGESFTDPGQPGKAQGCGQAIPDPKSDLVQIAQLKTRTNLCPACFAAWRSSNGK